MMYAPPGKSGALMMSISVSTVVFGWRSSAIVASQTSPRLKEQMEDAMPTAMPMLGETKMLGNEVGSSTGSVVELS